QPRQLQAEVQTGARRPFADARHLHRAVAFLDRVGAGEGLPGRVAAAEVAVVDAQHAHLGAERSLGPGQRLHVRFDPAGRGRVVLGQVAHSQRPSSSLAPANGLPCAVCSSPRGMSRTIGKIVHLNPGRRPMMEIECNSARHTFGVRIASSAWEDESAMKSLGIALTLAVCASCSGCETFLVYAFNNVTGAPVECLSTAKQNWTSCCRAEEAWRTLAAT